MGQGLHVPKCHITFLDGNCEVRNINCDLAKWFILLLVRLWWRCQPVIPTKEKLANKAVGCCDRYKQTIPDQTTASDLAHDTLYSSYRDFCVVIR